MEEGDKPLSRMCRTLTGAWIETTKQFDQERILMVAPSQVRGLKQLA